jgi:hypothetical protein
MTDEVYTEIEAIRPQLQFSEATALDALIYKGQWWSDENSKGLDACIERAKSLGYGRAAAWIMMERAMLGGIRPSTHL